MTAYEIRISDWSSDVCSTDLVDMSGPQGERGHEEPMHEVVIIGAGLGGIGVAIELREAGIEDFVLLERAADIGGTWRDNTYPGIASDVPAQVYQYSFELNPDWSHVFAPGVEVLARTEVQTAELQSLKPLS